MDTMDEAIDFGGLFDDSFNLVPFKKYAGLDAQKHDAMLALLNVRAILS